MKCDVRGQERELSGRFKGVEDCSFDANYVVHQYHGGKDWYLCKKHYEEIKKNSHYLDQLIANGRVEEL